jgi:two-component system, NarL family, nitrate/nitrite response regulator NarL
MDNYSNGKATGTALLENPRPEAGGRDTGIGQTGLGQGLGEQPGWLKAGIGSPSASPSPSQEPRAAGVARTISVCDTQPVTAEGIRTLLSGNSELLFAESTDSLQRALDLVRRQNPDVLIVDKAFGIQAILEWLGELHQSGGAMLPDTTGRTGVVIWGVSITEAEALRFLQSGARGILRKTAPVSVVLACLRTVAEGRSWMEDTVFRDAARSECYPRSELTSREQQVLELVEQGFKNKEIAQELGIRPGTVKIHLKHIFEKTGVRGRYGLALSGLKERGLVSMPA